MAQFVVLHRQAHPDRLVRVNVDHIALIAEEAETHTRIRLCDAMVLDVDESVDQVLTSIGENP